MLNGFSQDLLLEGHIDLSLFQTKFTVSPMLARRVTGETEGRLHKLDACEDFYLLGQSLRT